MAFPSAYMHEINVASIGSNPSPHWMNGSVSLKSNGMSMKHDS